MPTPTIEVTQLHFDRAEMQSEMDKVRTRFLMAAGAMVQASARSELRPGKESSRPGQTPNSPTKRLPGSISFALGEYRGKADCVIGPVRLGSTNRTVRSTGKPIARVLEQGGEILVLQEQHGDGTWHRAGINNRPGAIQVSLPTRWVKVTILARPFMRPALRTNIPKFAGLWRGIFRKG
jgi:hypothetical protein